MRARPTPEIDGMLGQLVPKLDFAPPRADFLYRDPYKTVRGNIQAISNMALIWL